jgi:hypothetical protein
MSILPEYVRYVLQRTPGLRRSISMTAARKPRPIQLPRLDEMPPRSGSDVVVLRLGPKPKDATAAAVAPIISKPAAHSFNWGVRADAAHTCAEWDASAQDDPFENPPSLWCPACRYAAHEHHETATRLAEEQPIAVPVRGASSTTPSTVKVTAGSSTLHSVKPGMVLVTAFQKEMIAAGGAVGRMMFDETVAGGKHMLSWAQYALMDNPRIFDVRPVSEEQRKAFRPVRSVVQMRSVRIKGGGSAQEREAECRTWLATPRNKRRAFYKGVLTADLCTPKDNSIVIANILNDAQTAYGDLRQLLGEHGVVVDMYRPAVPGAPMFVGFYSAADVTKVIAAFPEGIRYEGRMLPVERAKDRSKTSKQMAAAGGGK